MMISWFDFIGLDFFHKVIDKGFPHFREAGLVVLDIDQVDFFVRVQGNGHNVAIVELTVEDAGGDSPAIQPLDEVENGCSVADHD